MAEPMGVTVLARRVPLPSVRPRGLWKEHFLFHHGLCERGGRRARFDRYRLGDRLEEPLDLIRGGPPLPDVFSPSHATMVVSEPVYLRLASLSRLRFLKCRYKKIVDFRVVKGDETIHRQWMADTVPDPEQWLDMFDHEPDIASRMPSAYEIIPARHEDVMRTHWSDVRAVALPSLPAWNHDKLLECSPASCEEYPIQTSQYIFWILSQRASSILLPFIDVDFFDLETIPV